MSVHVTTSATVVSETGALTLARIGYHNLARAASISASSAEADYPALAARNDNTFEFWKPTGAAATWRADLASAQIVNYMGVYGDFNGAALRAQYSTDDAAWSNASDVASPTGDSALFLFPQQTARYWRLLVATAVPTIGHIRFGRILTMERPIMQGVNPITLARSTVIRPTISERGQWLGRSIIRSGLEASYQWKNLSAAWVRTTFDPFALDAREHPFFFAWRPISTYLDEIAYVWTKDDIRPVQSGPNSLMSLGFDVMGASGV